MITLINLSWIIRLIVIKIKMKWNFYEVWKKKTIDFNKEHATQNIKKYF